MVALGFAMLGLGLFSLVARWRHKLYDWSWLHRAAIAMGPAGFVAVIARSEEHTSELQSLMRISYAVFCLKKTKNTQTTAHSTTCNTRLHIQHTSTSKIVD